MNLLEGRYVVQDIPLEDIAREYGTPLYVYDADKIKSQYATLTTAFKGLHLKLKYAVKALTNINILRLMDHYGAGADCVSLNEVLLALKAGFNVNDIIYTPNCVSFEEIEQAMEIGVNINIDNLPFLEQFGEKYGHDYPVCIRINPHIVGGGNRNIQVGHVGSKFGISILQFEEVRAVVEKYNIYVRGVHSHTGSDILDNDVFLKGARVVFDCARHFKELDFLDFGSGFKVAYQNGDHTTDIPTLGARMTEAVNEFCAEYGKELEIWFEPGKYLVSESGYFLVNTNLIKESPACTFIGVDSGFNHLIRPMMYGSHHDIVNISNPSGEAQLYTVVGNICETDTFGADRKIHEARVGDVLAFKNAGAYGFEMSSNFNSRLRPAEVLIYNGEAKLIRERETFDELLRNQIEIEL